MEEKKVADKDHQDIGIPLNVVSRETGYSMEDGGGLGDEATTDGSLEGRSTR